MHKVYKVVERGPNDCYCSCFIRADAKLTYAIGKKTRAEFGFIFTFHTEEDARRFIREEGRNSFVVLECQGKKSRSPQAMTLHVLWKSTTMKRKRLEDFWITIRDNIRQNRQPIPANYRTLPTGTVLCPSVIPLKVMDA